MPLHDNELVPEPVTPVEDIAQLKPVDGDIVADRLTVPLNPLFDVTAIVEEPIAPARIVRLAGLVIIEKSDSKTVKVTVTECDSEPLVPVTVTAKAPFTPGVQDNEEVPDPVIVVGFITQLIPVLGEAAAARAMFLENP